MPVDEIPNPFRRARPVQSELDFTPPIPNPAEYAYYGMPDRRTLTPPSESPYLFDPIRMHEQTMARVREQYRDQLLASGMLHLGDFYTQSGITLRAMTSGHYIDDEGIDRINFQLTPAVPLQFIRLDINLGPISNDMMPPPYEGVGPTPPLVILEPVPLVDLSWDD